MSHYASGCVRVNYLSQHHSNLCAKLKVICYTVDPSNLSSLLLLLIRLSESIHSDSDDDDNQEESSEESDDSSVMEPTGKMKEEASTVLTRDSQREEIIPEKQLAELSDRSREHLLSYLQNVFSKLSVDSS